MSDSPPLETVLALAGKIVVGITAAATAVAAGIRWITARVDARIKKAEDNAEKYLGELLKSKDVERSLSIGLARALAELENLKGEPHSIPPPNPWAEPEPTGVRRVQDEIRLGRVEELTAPPIPELPPPRKKMPSHLDITLEDYLETTQPPPPMPIAPPPKPFPRKR